MATYRTTGFVIKRAEFGEADRIITLFTQYRGKITAIAKGARKMESRKGGNIELFNLTRFQLADGKSMDLVVEAEVEESFRNIRENLTTLSLIYQMVEVVDRFVQEDQSNPTAFLLFRQALEVLNAQISDAQARLITQAFMIKFLTTVGFKPELGQCVKCGDQVTEGGNLFSPHLGGLVDIKDRSQVAVGIEVSVDAIKILRFLQTQAWSQLLKLKAEDKILEEIESLQNNYLEFILETDLRATSFAQQVQKS